MGSHPLWGGLTLPLGHPGPHTNPSQESCLGRAAACGDLSQPPRLLTDRVPCIQMPTPGNGPSQLLATMGV